MIFGHGIDIVAIERIKETIEASDSFKTRVFTDKEIDYCQSKKNKFQSFAGRFAAKEAFIKALGTGFADGISWKDIEILNNELGKPHIELHNEAKNIFLHKKMSDILVSISHEKEYAIASVIINSLPKTY